MNKSEGYVLIGLVILAVLFSNTVEAQSIYGLNFLGEHSSQGSSRFSALGFSGLALSDSATALTQNAASIAGIRRFTFSINQVLFMSRVSSDEYRSNQARFELPSVMVAVPLREGVVLGLGYRTRFLGKGDFSYSRSIEGNPTPYEVYKHRSSLFTVPAALAIKLGERIRVAAEYQLERGSIKDEASVRFNKEDVYNPAISRADRYFSGSSFALYAQMEILPSIYVGGVFDARVDYSIDESFKYSRAEFDSTSSASFTLPRAFGIGMSLRFYKRWWLSSTYWQRSTPETGIFPQFKGMLNEEYLTGFGLEREGKEEGSFFSRIPLRFGFYQNRWHFDFPRGEPLYSRFVSMGTGFSMPGGPGRVDLSLEFGQIGSTDRNGIGESVFRVSVGVSASERWSKRRTEW